MYAMNATNDFDNRAGPAATTGTTTLPAYPSGRRQHAHHRFDFMRTVDNLLAEKGLLALAKTGAAPARVESLIDMDMDEIPELSPGNASYESRRALRAQHKVKNAQNDKQRCRFFCEDATKIYTMLYKCAEVANKTLAAGMLRRCNMATQEEWERIPGHSLEGYWDGRMAYQLLWNELFACTRSEADKALYLAALEVQEKHHLPDHCLVSMFEEKAYAFQHNIAPPPRAPLRAGRRSALHHQDDAKVPQGVGPRAAREAH